MKTQVSIFEERLSRAERQVRALRGVLVAAVLGAVVVVTARPGLTQGSAGQSQNTVKAPFVVVDESGKPLLVIRKSTLGGRFAELKMIDPEGRSVAGLESFYGSGRVFSQGSFGTAYLGK
jgi:hypothetical protein